MFIVTGDPIIRLIVHVLQVTGHRSRFTEFTTYEHSEFIWT